MDLLNIYDFTEIDRDFHRSLIPSSRVIDFMPVETLDTFFFAPLRNVFNFAFDHSFSCVVRARVSILSLCFLSSAT